MKTFTLYVCVFLLISLISVKYTQSIIQLRIGRLTARQDLHECINETNITSDEMFSISEILTDRYKEPGNEERMRKNGCIFHCMLKKVDIMEGSDIIIDKLHNEVLKKSVGPLATEAIKIMDNCIDTTKNITEKCDRAFEFMICSLTTAFKAAQQASTVNEENINENEYTTSEPDH